MRYIAEGGSTANLSEVGRFIDVNRVTVMRLLATMEQEDMVERLPQGGHRIGLGFLTMAASGLGSLDLLSAGRRLLVRLCRDLGLSAYLVVMDASDIVYVAREMPESGLVSHIRVGSRVAAHLTAPGRAMLATLMPEDLAQRMAGVSAPDQAGKRGSSTLERLNEVLAREREQGCAWSFSGYEAGINACAAAVRSVSGSAVAAISVVGPERVFGDNGAFVKEVEAAVKLATDELARIAAC